MLIELCTATAAERRRPLSGDEFVPHPSWSVTHAITIDAPPEQVWPWLVQMGSGRAGWYAYDCIDNGGTPSTRRIIAELQHVAVGDLMPALPGLQDSFIVLRVIPTRALILGVPLLAPDAAARGRDSAALTQRVSWALVLEPMRHGHTRLITRGRVSTDWLRGQEYAPVSPGGPTLIERVYQIMAKMPPPLLVPFAGFGHYLMQSQQLRGIKQRAERARRRAGSGRLSGKP